MKKIPLILLILMLAGGAGAGAYYFFIIKGNGGSANSSQNPVYVDSVSMIAGLDSAGALQQRYAGVVEPQDTWSVKLGTDKTVKEVYVKVGDQVKEGDKIFTYDTTSDENKLEQNAIDQERLQNEIVNLRINIENYQKQLPKAKDEDEKQQINNSILVAENGIKTAEYDLRQKELERKNLEESIANADVFSKIDGVVQSINDPTSGSSDTGSSDAFITIMKAGDFRVKGTLNEQNFRNITAGDRMIAHSRVDDAYWVGTVESVSTENSKSNTQNSYYDSGDSGNGSSNYSFYLELDSSEGLMLGQHLYLELDVGQTSKKDGIWISEYYFTQEEDGSWWVWASSPKGLLEKRKVVLGEYDDKTDTYQVKEGLTAKDYITAPQELLEEGLPVILMDSSQYMGDEDAYYEEDYADDEDSGDEDEFDDGMFGFAEGEFDGIEFSDDDVFIEDEG